MTTQVFLVDLRENPMRIDRIKYAKIVNVYTAIART